jgi:hypothetical protein
MICGCYVKQENRNDLVVTGAHQCRGNDKFLFAADMSGREAWRQGRSVWPNQVFHYRNDEPWTLNDGQEVPDHR